MAKYLSDAELNEAKRLLTLFYSLPYGTDIPGPVWEQILAKAKGGRWSGKRENRPDPDVIVGNVRISVKTEKLDEMTSQTRTNIHDFIGAYPDLIVARPPVDEGLANPADLHELTANQLGTLVLEAYNKIVRENWDRMSVLFRLRKQEFIYWEFVPPLYNPKDYVWQETGKAKGQSRNISTTEVPAKFRWNSRGGQLYIRYRIPDDADIFSITPKPISLDDLAALMDALVDVDDVSASIQRMIQQVKKR